MSVTEAADILLLTSCFTGLSTS